MLGLACSPEGLLVMVKASLMSTYRLSSVNLDSFNALCGNLEGDHLVQRLRLPATEIGFEDTRHVKRGFEYAGWRPTSTPEHSRSLERLMEESIDLHIKIILF